MIYVDINSVINEGHVPNQLMKQLVIHTNFLSIVDVQCYQIMDAMISMF